MNKYSDLLFRCLKAALFEERLDVEVFSGLDRGQWDGLYALAKRQGLGSIVFEALSKQADEIRIPQDLKMKWIAMTMNVEKWYGRQFAAASSFADLMASDGVDIAVLKGIAMSSYYPVPSHRECGDLDCFLGMNGIWGAGYENGNVLAENAGASVERDFYKHSHIRYKGLEIENHQFCLAIRGSREMKRLERHLRKIIMKDGKRYIGDTKLLNPSADFNALFLTLHSFTHFLSEGLNLRQIADWVLLLKHEQNKIDWAEFYRWCDDLSLTRFVNTLNHIAVDCFGLKLSEAAVKTDSTYAGRILDDCFNLNGVFNKGYSPWKARMVMIVKRLAFSWKYHKIYRRSVTVALMKLVGGFIFEQDPKL